MSSSDIKTVKLHRILSNAHFIGQSVWQKYSKIQTCVLMGAWRVKAGRWNSHTESSFCTSCQPTLFFNYCMWMLGRFHSGKGKVTLPESYKKWSNFVKGCKVKETSNMIMTRKSTESATNVRGRRNRSNSQGQPTTQYESKNHQFRSKLSDGVVSPCGV